MLFALQLGQQPWALDLDTRRAVRHRTEESLPTGNMPTGAHGTLLPIHTTKIGAGDKERAYVVRQNFFLKIVLAVVLTIAGLAGILCRTTYEIHVQRRDSIQDSRDHRDEEHASHLRVIRLSTLLQQRLKDEVHDMKLLTKV